MQKLEKACRAIAALNGECRTFTELAKRLMREVRSLVPCDTINIGTVDLSTEEAFHFALDGFLMPPGRRALLPQFKHENPMLEYARRNGWNPPLRFTDFLSRRQFEETGIYRECYKGYTHSMLSFGVSAAPGLNVSVVLSRCSGEFPDIGCGHLSVLQPLVTTVISQRLLTDALHGAESCGAVPGVIYGVNQMVQMMDERAVGLLERYFLKHSRHRLPDRLWQRMKSGNRQAMEILQRGDGDSLWGRIDMQHTQWRLHLWEHTDRVERNRLQDCGLTKRQHEVVEWLAKGKSNAEIAIILGISPRTVEKHLEAIYRHTGTENRMAAVHHLRRAYGARNA